MEHKINTSLVSAFARAYHSKNSSIKVFDDSIAYDLIGKEDYDLIGENMSKGIRFFNPQFIGSDSEALRWIVDHQLAPTPLGRAAYCERMLENAVKMGASQYLIFASGLDSFSYRQPDFAKSLKIFELDLPVTLVDKQQRVKKAKLSEVKNLTRINVDFTKTDWGFTLADQCNFNSNEISFCSLLGISYYLEFNDFEKMISTISQLTAEGTTIVFDYPEEKDPSDQSIKQQLLAKEAGEKMIGNYSYSTIEKMLEQNGFLIYEHLDPDQITQQIFNCYNLANPDHTITAFRNVNYCLAVKKIVDSELAVRF